MFRRLLSRLGASTLVVLVLVSTLGQACGHKECNYGSTLCGGPTTLRVCTGGEGYAYFTDQECPAESHCEATAIVAACVGQDEGGVCQSNAGCKPDFRCLNGRCVGPSNEEKAQCNAAATIQLNDDGTPINVDIPLRFGGPATSLICGSRGVVEGYVFIETPHGARVSALSLSPREQFPNGIGLTEVKCNSLYQTFNCSSDALSVDLPDERGKRLLFYSASVTFTDSSAPTALQVQIAARK